MTELVRQPIVHPLTGQVLDLDKASPQDLAEMLVEADEYKSMLQELRNYIGSEVQRRMDAGAKWTLHAGDYKLTSSSPAPVEEFDGHDLYLALEELVQQGVITQDALERAVEIKVEYKPRKAGINALRKLGPIPNEAVGKHVREVVPRRYVKVSRG